MKYDKAKIREACALLLGWSKGEPLNGLDVWVSPSGVHSIWQDGNCAGANGWIDPTEDLNAALPLMRNPRLILMLSNDKKNWHCALIEDGDRGRIFVNHTSATMAICLCALRVAGRNIKDFES